MLKIQIMVFQLIQLKQNYLFIIIIYKILFLTIDVSDNKYITSANNDLNKSVFGLL